MSGRRRSGASGRWAAGRRCRRGDDVDCERLAELAMIRIARLEACWSPFLPDSDVSRLNRADGAPIAVRPATVTLLQAMAEATVVTGGAYDPTVPGHRRRRARRGSTPSPIDPDGAWSCSRPPGSASIPGGIGKGLAADLVVADTMAAGAAAVAVIIGGDGRVSSDDRAQSLGDRDRRPRRHDVDRPRRGRRRGRRHVRAAVGRTSSIRPPASSCEPGDVVQVSVLAGTGASAEALTKAVLRRRRSGHRRPRSIARASACSPCTPTAGLTCQRDVAATIAPRQRHEAVA